MTYSGPERRVNKGRRYSDSHGTLRLALIVWIIGFSLFTMLEWHNIGNTKASVKSLEKTNEALVEFLCKARESRLKLAKEETGAARKIDLQAAHGYDVIVKVFNSAGCSDS